MKILYYSRDGSLPDKIEQMDREIPVLAFVCKSHRMWHCHLVGSFETLVIAYPTHLKNCHLSCHFCCTYIKWMKRVRCLNSTIGIEPHRMFHKHFHCTETMGRKGSILATKLAASWQRLCVLSSVFPNTTLTKLRYGICFPVTSLRLCATDKKFS